MQQQNIKSKFEFRKWSWSIIKSIAICLKNLH